MKRAFSLLNLLVSIFNTAFSQKNGFQALLDSGKGEYKRQNLRDTPDFRGALALLEGAVRLNPKNTEARYFLGYTLDKMNMSDAKEMAASRLATSFEASKQFELINKLEPVYQGELSILDPYMKITSIWGSQALAYLSQNKQDSTVWALKEGRKRGGFLETTLAYNRYILSSCKKGAILFVYGDGLTFPLYYLQILEGFRTDVTIVELSLVHTQWYPKLLKETGVVKIGYSLSELDTLTYREWAATEVTIPCKADTTKGLTWTLKPSYYGHLLRGDFVIWDIIKQNLCERELYFARGTDTSQNLYLSSFLVSNGATERLRLSRNDTPDTLMMRTLLKELRLPNGSEQEVLRSKEALHNVNNIRFAYIDLIRRAFEKEQYKYAAALTKDMEDKLPVSKYGFLTVDIENYYKLFTDIVKDAVEQEQKAGAD